MDYTAQEAFLLNVNRKVLTEAEPPHSHTMTMVQMHTLCDGGDYGADARPLRWRLWGPIRG